MLKRYCHIFLLLFFIALINNYVIAQSEANFEKGSILVKFRNHKDNDFLISGKINIKINDFRNNSLKNIFSKSGFKKAEKIFTDFLSKDTLFVDQTGKSKKLFDLSKWYKIYIDEDQDISKIVEELENFPEIEAVTPNYSFHVDDAPNDPSFSNGSQWSLVDNTYTIRASEAWNYSVGRSDVRVGVIDTGIDYLNSDMDSGNRSHVVAGYDFQNNDSDPRDDTNHGTEAASIIGAITNNNQNIAGIMWNCQLVPLKAGVGDNIYFDKAAQAVNWCINNNVDIINMSFSGPAFTGFQLFKEATYNAYAVGKVLVTSMGNNDSEEIVYPANFPWTIAVGATNELGQRVSKALGYNWGSNYGNHISIVAPGVNCPANAFTQSNPMLFGGTSCSAPHVTGVAGLILSKSRDLGLNLTNDEIKHLMETTARRYDGIRWDRYSGYGILNAGGALKTLQTNSYSIINAVNGFNSTKIHSDQWWIINGGTYKVDVYKVTKNIDISQYPAAKAWIRESSSTLGAACANSNNGYSWADSYISGNTFTIETYIYYIKMDAWNNPVNQWWPTAINNVQAEYRVLYISPTISVPGNYSSIASALSAAISGQTVLISGSQSLTGNINIPNGVTLKFLSGSSLNFNNYGIFGGTIILENGANINGVYFGGGFYHLQTAINNASNGQTVNLLGRTYNTSISFTGKNNLIITGQGISQTYINGEITAYSSSGLSLSGFRCNKFTLNGSNNSYMNINIIGSGYNAGFYPYNCTGGHFYGEINNSYCGVYAYASTHSINCLDSYSTSRINDHDIGVSAYNGSNLSVYRNGSAIEICGTGTYDLYADASTITATNCSYTNGSVRKHEINGGHAYPLGTIYTCLHGIYQNVFRQIIMKKVRLIGVNIPVITLM